MWKSVTYSSAPSSFTALDKDHIVPDSTQEIPQHAEGTEGRRVWVWDERSGGVTQLLFCPSPMSWVSGSSSLNGFNMTAIFFWHISQHVNFLADKTQQEPVLQLSTHTPYPSLARTTQLQALWDRDHVIILFGTTVNMAGSSWSKPRAPRCYDTTCNKQHGAVILNISNLVPYSSGSDSARDWAPFSFVFHVELPEYTPILTPPTGLLSHSVQRYCQEQVCRCNRKPGQW